MCLLNGLNDSGQGGVARQRRDLELQFTGLIDGARENLIARSLVHGNALASHRGLVDGPVPLHHLAVQRHPFTRLDAHSRADSNRGDRRGGPCAIGAQHQSLFRRQFQQTLDRIACPVHGLGLNQLSNCVQGHHHGSLGPLADEESARDGHRHQGIDVELAT